MEERYDMNVGLFLIGTGVGNPNGMTLAGREAAAACEYRFLESYTSHYSDSALHQLRNMVGNFDILRRPEIEKPDKILKLAKESSVALLVIGDPMQATTHVDILLRCHYLGIKTEIFHATSAVSVAIAGSYLQSYRFGRQVTLAFPIGEYLATSPIEMHCVNYALELHTLVLFDLDPTGEGIKQPNPMTPKQAIQTIRKIVEKMNNSYTTNDDPMHSVFKNNAIEARLSSPVEEWSGILCSNLGTKQQHFFVGTLGEISKQDDEGIHCLILIGELQNLEREALEKLHLSS